MKNVASPEDTMTMEDVESIGLVMANVDRLIEDSTLLIRNGRLPSALVLNIIALEEVGKVVHMRWRHLGRETTRQNRTGHLQKQWAVACVLIADKMIPFYKEILSGSPDSMLSNLDNLAADFMISHEREFFENVIAKNVDRAKQLGLYEDEDSARTGRTRESIDHNAILNISGTTLRALELMKDRVTLVAASVFYEIMPPLQDAILAEANKL